MSQPYRSRYRRSFYTYLFALAFLAIGDILGIVSLVMQIEAMKWVQLVLQVALTLAVAYLAWSTYRRARLDERRF